VNCITPPTSLADVPRILEACGGPDWLSRAAFGLAVVAAVLVVSAVLAALVVGARHHG
jgi:hypothetical protein